MLLSLAACGPGRQPPDSEVEDVVAIDNGMTTGDGTSPIDGPARDGTNPDDAMRGDASLPDGVTVLTDGAIVMMLPDGAVVPYDAGPTMTGDSGPGPDGADAADEAAPDTGGPGIDVTTPPDGPIGSEPGRDDGPGVDVPTGGSDTGMMSIDGGTMTLPDGAVVETGSGSGDGSTGPTDTGPMELDTVVPHLPGPPVFETCNLAATTVRCTADSMCNVAGGERCLSANCGDNVRTCQPAGRSCAGDTDCLSGLQRCAAGRCVATGTDCGDTRACPWGYLCEGTAGSRRCVDRRRSCTDDLRYPCPANSLCYSDGQVSPICIPLLTRCATNTACIRGSVCQDVDGDGVKECVPEGPCSASRRCAAPMTCGASPVDIVARCGNTGVCSSDASCAAGYRCVDPWGTGVKECRSSSEPCQLHTQCGAQQLCDPAPSGERGLPAGCH